MVVKDLQLTVTPLEESKIMKVYAGTYPQSSDDADGSINISFGSLYDKETRTVLVDLRLPAVSRPAGANVLEIAYQYRWFHVPTFTNYYIYVLCVSLF